MKLSHIFKVILLLLLPCFVLAQYPNNPVKSRLGWQTTGDGLVYRGAGAPAYSPGTLFNAWMYLDTTNFVLYGYIGFQWQRLPLVNNGLNADGAYHQLGGSLVENTTVSTGNYDLILGRTSGTNFAQMSILNSGAGASFFNSYNSGSLEAEITAANGTASMLVENVAVGGNSSIYVNKDGFKAFYLHPSLGTSYLSMDSTKFRIRGLASYASHSAADAVNTEYQLYKIDNSRAIFLKNSTVVSQDILGTGTADRSARWSATNTLGTGSWSDNLTRLQAQVPVQFQSTTTAGLPTGVTGYHVYNTTTNGPAWYQGSRWAYGLESTANRFTSGQVIHADANGQATGITALSFLSGNLKVTTGSSSFGFEIASTVSGNAGSFSIRPNSSAVGGPADFTIRSVSGGRLYYSAYEHIFTGGVGIVANGISGLNTITVGSSTMADGNLELKTNADNTSSQWIKFSNRLAKQGIFMQSLGSWGRSDMHFVFQSDASVTAAVPVTDTKVVFQSNGNVLIGTTTEVPSALLTVTSTTKGIRPPLWTATQRTAISSPATGLFGYQTDGTEGMYIKAGSAWKRLLWEGDAATNSIYNNLPLGNVSIAASTNNLTISNMGALSLGGASFEIYADDTESTIYNPEYAEIGTDAAKFTADESNDRVEASAANVYLTGLVRALQEEYNNITSTASPVTLSANIPDNLINQGSTQATFTLNFPASPVDGQVLKITFNNAITTLTLDGNGNTIVGSAVTTGVSGSQRVFKYYASASAWIKIY